MIPLPELWLPVLLSAVFVFVLSSIFHMVIPIHINDFTKLPGEENVLAEIRNQKVEPGAYVFPCPDSMKDMASPEMMEKYNRGPVGFMIVKPNGPFQMGKSLIQWFLFSILIGVLTAFVSTTGLERGASFGPVLRAAGVTAFAAYGIGAITDSIWKGQRWSVTLKFLFDGVVYGLATGLTFGWLWPGAE